MTANEARQLTENAKKKYEGRQREEYEVLQQSIRKAASEMKSSLTISHPGPIIYELLQQDGFTVRAGNDRSETILEISW